MCYRYILNRAFGGFIDLNHQVGLREFFHCGLKLIFLLCVFWSVFKTDDIGPRSGDFEQKIVAVLGDIKFDLTVYVSIVLTKALLRRRESGKESPTKMAREVLRSMVLILNKLN